MAESDSILHSLTSEIQESVFKSQILSCTVFVFNHERKNCTLGKNLDIFSLDFDFSSIHVSIDHGVRSSSDNSLYCYAVFQFKFLCLLLKERGSIVVHDYLSLAISVAEVNKMDGTMVSVAMYPSV